jgi:hypothetical protein
VPRVNRDLQRRMAARRERERRRPGERRYRFDGPEAAVEPDETLVDDGQAMEAVDAPPRPARAAREATTEPTAPTRAGVKSAPRPFSAYKDEYSYVYTDLRRVAVVIGSLLLVLIVLFFVLPLLIH